MWSPYYQLKTQYGGPTQTKLQHSEQSWKKYFHPVLKKSKVKLLQ